MIESDVADISPCANLRVQLLKYAPAKQAAPVQLGLEV
jgi:hypothetical protein